MLKHTKTKLENRDTSDLSPSNFTFQIVNNKGADQSARMRRLICVFVVRKGFSHRDPYDVEV